MTRTLSSQLRIDQAKLRRWLAWDLAADLAQARLKKKHNTRNLSLSLSVAGVVVAVDKALGERQNSR